MIFLKEEPYILNIDGMNLPNLSVPEDESCKIIYESRRTFPRENDKENLRKISEITNWLNDIIAKLDDIISIMKESREG